MQVIVKTLRSHKACSARFLTQVLINKKRFWWLLHVLFATKIRQAKKFPLCLLSKIVALCLWILRYSRTSRRQSVKHASSTRSKHSSKQWQNSSLSASIKLLSFDLFTEGCICCNLIKKNRNPFIFRTCLKESFFFRKRSCYYYFLILRKTPWNKGKEHNDVGKKGELLRREKKWSNISSFKLEDHCFHFLL